MKTAIVTGSASGIGLAIAKKLAKEGAAEGTVVIAAEIEKRNIDRIPDLIQHKINRLHGRIAGIKQIPRDQHRFHPFPPCKLHQAGKGSAQLHPANFCLIRRKVPPHRTVQMQVAAMDELQCRVPLSCFS